MAMVNDSDRTIMFMDTLFDSLDPTVPMRLLRENAEFAVYVGLWSSWWINDTEQVTAKIVLVTVLKNPLAPKAPAGPLPLASLVPFLVVQLQSVDQDNDHWAAIRDVLRDELEAQRAASHASVSSRPQFNPLLPDPVQSTHQIRKIREPTILAAMTLQQTPYAGKGVVDGQAPPRPPPVLGRRRVEYSVDPCPTVRVFIEKHTTKHPLHQEMESDAGLVKSGTVLGAINEWRTWFIADNV